MAGLTIALPAAGQCQQAKVFADDANAGDGFGVSVDHDGDLLAVGAYQDDEVATNCGAAYVLRRSEDGWLQEDKVIPPDGAVDDWFGTRVALEGSLLLVGAPYHDAAGVNAGAVYVYHFDASRSEWLFESKLLPPVAGFLRFGWEVDLDGNTAVIGSGSQTNPGFAQVLRRDPGTGLWSSEGVFSSGLTNDGFGAAVRISGDVIAVSANIDHEANTWAGAVYVYRRNLATGTWPQETKLMHSKAEASAYYGSSVALADGVIAIGAVRYAAEGLGEVVTHVRRRDGLTGAWTEEAILSGGSEGNIIWVANWLSLSGSRLAMGDTFDVHAPGHVGSVHVFEHDAAKGEWNLLTTLRAAEPTRSGFNFGVTLSMHNEEVVAGYRQDPAQGSQTGSAFVFEINGDDCNRNGVCDPTDITSGASIDANGNGVPDECEVPGDITGDGVVNIDDLLAVIAAWGPCPTPPALCSADVTLDGEVDIDDLLLVIANWG